MTKADFLRAFESELEIPGGSLTGSQALTEVEAWDSMAAVLFIALADEKMGVSISGNQIARSKTVSDLLALLGDRLTD